MLSQISRILRRRLRRENREINPEDIFLDSTNLPGHNRDLFEGRMEEPIGDTTFLVLKLVFLLIIIFLSGKLFGLQFVKGESFALVSENNRLERSIIFADRGLIYDRNKISLVENGVKPEENDFASRKYTELDGLASVVGYTKYPSKDNAGNYYDESYHGQAGVEKVYDPLLAGRNGSKLTETDALGKVSSESLVEVARKGEDLTLSLDAKLTQALYKSMRSLAQGKGFTGGAGVIMDVRTGEILALTSYPEYDQNVITSGTDKKEIARLLADSGKPFLNRAVSGLYTPGSIVKPIVALGVLGEGVIDPLKKILSTGSISLPNPYDPDNPSVFKDWKAHGSVDMRDALAVSSDVYFYEVGGGFEGQPGLGITKLDKYFTLFGMAEKTGVDLPAEAEGYIATPAWKIANFPDDPDWRLGNTYHTAIGQYGTQVTPLGAVRWTAALANGGDLLIPSVILGGHASDSRVLRRVDVPEEDFQIVREGMRLGVVTGIATALNVPAVQVAAKSGTAELGASKSKVNSWITGFFPYKEPRYAFAVIMESGPATNIIGATYVMRDVLDWMSENTPEYLK